MILNSAKLGRLSLSAKPFASGGAGEVYRATSDSGDQYCVKILTKPKDDVFDKLRYMVSQPPGIISRGWGKLCWPIDLVFKPRVAEPVGYVMALAFDDSLELSNLTNLRWPGGERPELAVKVDRKSPQGLSNRLKISCNIAAAIEHIHAMGYVFVDLKPQNVLISPKGEVSVVDLDSLQIKVGPLVYRGPLGSPEYMPSESYQMDFGVGPAVEQSWDCFALAVIIYEILLGIHPYTGALKPSAPDCPTIADSIRLRMYVHGVNRSQFQVIPPPHAALAHLPNPLVALFSKAFESTLSDDRPSAEAWGQALFAAAKNIGADLKPHATSVHLPAPGRTLATPMPAGGSTQPQNCWGPWGKTCPHELRGVFKRGLPNAVARGGISVYFCDDCLPSR
jgi:DNA-binding helix-hairpin-helix protein with protein kinase domain